MGWCNELSKNAPVLEPKTHSKGIRLTIGQSKFYLIIGFYNLNKSINCHRSGIIPHIHQSGWTKDHLETKGFSLWIRKFCILFYKYEHKDKFNPEWL